VKKMVVAWGALLYGAGLAVCQASYWALPFRIRKVNAKVISVGNITWGGTGKTPLVIKIARELGYYGKKVAVLTRGYGMDEVEELRRALPDVPVVVGRDRVKSAEEAISKHGAEYLVLDDGFQHIRLHRDLDIVNLNAVEPFGPGGLIPAGTLREPLAHLKRAHLFMISKSDLGSKNVAAIRQKLLAVKPDALILEGVHKPVRFTDPARRRQVGLQEIRGKRVAAISAIGDPFSFEKTVENLGGEIVLAARFDDHHAFTREELIQFVAECRELGVREVVTTEKDYPRLEPHLKTMPELAAYPFLTLEIEFVVNDEESLLKRCINP